MFEINREEHNQRAAEHQSRREQPPWTVVAPAKRERRGRDQLHERVLPRDSLPAVAASAAQREIAEDRNVVEPREHMSALRTRRSGRDDRPTTRQPAGADVQETADDRAEDGRDHQRKKGHAGGRREMASGSSGGGQRGDVADSWTRPSEPSPD